MSNATEEQKPMNRAEIGELRRWTGKAYDQWLRRKGLKATAWKGRTYQRRYHPLRGSPVKQAIRALKGGEA